MLFTTRVWIWLDCLDRSNGCPPVQKMHNKVSNIGLLEYKGQTTDYFMFSGFFGITLLFLSFCRIIFSAGALTSGSVTTFSVKAFTTFSIQLHRWKTSCCCAVLLNFVNVIFTINNRHCDLPTCAHTHTANLCLWFWRLKKVDFPCQCLLLQNQITERFTRKRVL